MKFKFLLGGAALEPPVRVDYNRYIRHFNDNCPRLSRSTEKLIAGGCELKVDSQEQRTIVSRNDSSAIFLRWYKGAVSINNHCMTV